MVGPLLHAHWIRFNRKAPLSFLFVYRVSHIRSLRFPYVLVSGFVLDKSVRSTMLLRPVPHIASPTDGWSLRVLQGTGSFF